MNDNNRHHQNTKNMGSIIDYKCSDIFGAGQIKDLVQGVYQTIGNSSYKNIFLNWGLWDKKIYNEYHRLPTATNVQIYSQLLLYYLIRPLVTSGIFNKRLLDVGCGNGIGLRNSSVLLNSKFALGVDSTPQLVTNANHNFHVQNKIHYKQSDAEHLTLENESFDIVLNLESSHLYPQIENFFSEVERVLAPGGFFCYADLNVPNKNQALRLDAFVKNSKYLKIIKKENITKMVQSSIYQRTVVNVDELYKKARFILSCSETDLVTEFPALMSRMGLEFLPWWKIRFKNRAFDDIAKNARKSNYWISLMNIKP